MAYIFPKSVDIFDQTEPEKTERAEIEETAGKINSVLAYLGIDGKVAKYADGAKVTRYFIKLAPKVKYSKLKSIEQDFVGYFGNAKFSDPSENTPETFGLYGLDVPKKKQRNVRMSNFRANWDGAGMAAFALGENTTGTGIICDIAKLPHLLIAGSSGSGKSVCINSIISTLIFRNLPERLRLTLIDPKQVELSQYAGLPHLTRPIATTVNDAINSLKYEVAIMECRYKTFEEAGCKDIDEYNYTHNAKFGRHIVVIDELADLMLSAKKAVEPLIVRLAQKARAAGIHLVVATQEPTCSVISGLIKANMPCRIAFATATSKESVVILGHGGAEKLLGKGDMLYKTNDEVKPIRLQGVYVSPEEINRLVNFIREQNYTPNIRTA